MVMKLMLLVDCYLGKEKLIKGVNYINLDITDKNDLQILSQISFEFIINLSGI